MMPRDRSGEKLLPTVQSDTEKGEAKRRRFGWEEPQPAGQQGGSLSQAVGEPQSKDGPMWG